MRIGLDFDGVIADFGTLKADVAFELYGIRVPPQFCKHAAVVAHNYLSEEQYRTVQNIAYRTREIGLRMAPVEGALKFLPQLLDAGHSILVITSRDTEALAVANEWLTARGFELPLVGTGKTNSKATAATGLDVFADDDLIKLEPLVPVVAHRFLFSWAYNEDTPEGNIAVRVKSWEELHHRIQALATP